jgi:tetratricopeptide (TPR) repeat protein
VIARSVREYPALLRFRCALAHLYAEIGRERDARPVFDGLLARDLAHEHLDAEWLFSIALLADPCAQLGDGAAAEKLYALLLPYGQLYAMAPVETIFGTVARCLGVLATTLGRPDDAERHFEAALDIERRMRARPWLAHAQHSYGAMLLERGEAKRGSALLGEAAAIYGELGMDSWAARVAALSEPARTAR